MKKLTLILMAAILMTAMGSCKKDKTKDKENENDDNTTVTTGDGVYNPSKKIYKCYIWDTYYEQKRLDEVWHWNGKQLSSIDDMNGDGSVGFTIEYSYENNRLARIDYKSYYIRFQYNEGRLNKIIKYCDNVKSSEFSFSYGSNNKVDKITGAFYDWKKTPDGKFNELGLVLPRKVAESFEQRREKWEAKRSPKDDAVETFTLRLTWDGDNVSEYNMDGEFSDGTFSEIITVQMTASYDNKHNPKWGFMDRYFPEEPEGFIYYCKNNMTRYTYTEHEIEYENGVLDGDHSSTHEGYISYQYEDNYPIMVTETEETDSGGTYTNKYYYEYL